MHRGGDKGSNGTGAKVHQKRYTNMDAQGVDIRARAGWTVHQKRYTNMDALVVERKRAKRG